MKLCCDENIKRSITNLLEQEGYPGVLFLDEQRASPRTVVTAIQRIERRVTETAGQVWHVPNG